MPLSSKIVFGQSEHREKKWTTQQPNHHTHVPDVLVSTDVKVLKVVGLGSVVLLVVFLWGQTSPNTISNIGIYQQDWPV